MRPSALVARNLVDALPPGGKSVGSRGGGGKTAKQMTAEHLAVMGERPMLVRCRCGYRYEGAAARALELIQRHREKRHPELLAVGKGRRAREHRRALVLAARRKADAAKDRGAGPMGSPGGAEHVETITPEQSPRGTCSPGPR